MKKINCLIFFFILLIVSCKTKNTHKVGEQDIQEVTEGSANENNTERIAQLKSKITQLQNAETNRKDFYEARNNARIAFEKRLTDEEKLVICEVRQDYIYGTRLMEVYFTQAFKKLKAENELTEEMKLNYEIQKLRWIKQKNYIIELEDMLPIINGRMKEEIYQLSNKYYGEILRVESQYLDRTKEFYEQNAERISNDSIELVKSVNKPGNKGGLVLGRMDHTMDFLIVDPNSSETKIKILKRRIQQLEKDELDQQDYLIERNKARKNFEKRLTNMEKLLINEVRQNFLSYKKTYKEYFDNEIQQEVQKNNGKLSEELSLRKKEHELKMNRWDNYLFDKRGIATFASISKRNREMIEDIYKLADKYYLEILRVESKYSESVRSNYEKNAEALRKDSIFAASEDEYYPAHSPRLSSDKRNYAIEFLIVDP